MSGCLASEIPDLIMKDQLDKARDAVDFFKQTLGAETFPRTPEPRHSEQAKVNKQLIAWRRIRPEARGDERRALHRGKAIRTRTTAWSASARNRC